MATDPTGATILLGPRTWGKRPSTAGVILHTTEYPTASEADARRCIADQSRRTSTGGWAQPGSYNYVIHDSGAFLSVPYLEASGGLNPASTSWAPGRYPWLQQLLPAAAYADPTMHHLQLSFSGRTVDLLHALSIGRAYAKAMVETAARIIVWAEAQPWAADNLVISGHMHWQGNRSDPGQALLDAVTNRAIELSSAPTPPPAPPPPDYQALYEAELGKVTSLRTRLGTVKRKVKALAEDVADD